jgi:hypothetical protein
MNNSVQSIFVHVGAHERRRGGRTAQYGAVLFAAVYRTWTDSAGVKNIQAEGSHLVTLIDQIERAAELSKAVILLGDFNLNVERREDKTYGRQGLLNKFAAATAATGFEYLPTPTTWSSYGRFQDGQVQRHSTIDHCYVIGVRATVSVLPDATTDHRPLLLVVSPSRISGSSDATDIIRRQNFKAVRSEDLKNALENTWDWANVHRIHDMNEVHEFVVKGITAALDVVAPMAEIRVKRGTTLISVPRPSGSLSRETEREAATSLSSGT